MATRGSDDPRHQSTSLLIGVAGGSGAGKTTIVNGLQAALRDADYEIVSQDSYYRDHGHLSPIEREGVNYDHPSEFETALLIAHLRALRAGSPVDAPHYDFATHTRSPMTRRLNPAPVIVVEGILVLADASLRSLFDLCVFIEADRETRLERRIRRDVTERGRTAASVREQFGATVAPMHDAFVEPSKAHADLVLCGKADPAISVALLLERLSPAAANA